MLKINVQVVYWISYIVSSRTDHKFTILTRLNQTTQLHQGAPPRGLREHVRTETGEFREQGILSNCFQGTTLLGSNFINFQLQFSPLWIEGNTSKQISGTMTNIFGDQGNNANVFGIKVT